MTYNEFLSHYEWFSVRAIVRLNTLSEFTSDPLRHTSVESFDSRTVSFNAIDECNDVVGRSIPAEWMEIEEEELRIRLTAQFAEEKKRKEEEAKAEKEKWKAQREKDEKVMLLALLNKWGDIREEKP